MTEEDVTRTGLFCQRSPKESIPSQILQLVVPKNDYQEFLPQEAEVARLQNLKIYLIQRYRSVYEN
jgi:hypothetical protein